MVYTVTSMQMKVGFHFEDLSDMAIRVETLDAFKQAVVDEVLMRIPAARVNHWRDLVGDTYLPYPNPTTGNIPDYHLQASVTNWLQGLPVNINGAVWDDKDCRMNLRPPAEGEDAAGVYFSWCKSRSVELVLDNNPWTMENAVSAYETAGAAANQAASDADEDPPHPDIGDDGTLPSQIKSQLSNIRLRLFVNWHVEDVV